MNEAFADAMIPTSLLLGLITWAITCIRWAKVPAKDEDSGRGFIVWFGIILFTFMYMLLFAAGYWFCRLVNEVYESWAAYF